jgi:DegV family protein with EDD domain
MTVQVITDSTSDIPPELATKLSIRVVPIYVHFGEQTFRDGLDIRNDEFYTMLKASPIHPTTSQPNPNDFASVYKEFCGKVEGIASIHISSKISGTYNTALLGRELIEDGCPIEVVDSKFNSAGLGLIVIAAARLAQAGASLAEVIHEANSAIQQVSMFGIFSTMKYLARSGRVNKAVATASEFLHVMPLLGFQDGEVIRGGLVRTFSKGIDRLYDFVKKRTIIAEATIVHSAMIDQALGFKKMLCALIPETKISIAELGAGLGVHGGPGVLLVAVREINAAQI